MPRGTELIRSLVERISKTNTFDKCLRNLTIVSAENGNCKVQFTVQDEHLNFGGTLHGGFTSTLVDVISTYALMTQGTGSPGVSVDLHVSFLKAAFPGDKVTVDAKTIRSGRSLAFLAVELTRDKEGNPEVIARGGQTKYFIQSTK